MEDNCLNQNSKGDFDQKNNIQEGGSHEYMAGIEILFSAFELPSHMKQGCCAIVRAFKITQLWGTITRAAHTLKDVFFL